MGAEIAAGCGEWDIAKALRARLGRARGRAAKTKQKSVDRKDNEEVDHQGDQGKSDGGVEEVSVLDDATMEAEGEG